MLALVLEQMLAKVYVGVVIGTGVHVARREQKRRGRQPQGEWETRKIYVLDTHVRQKLWTNGHDVT